MITFIEDLTRKVLRNSYCMNSVEIPQLDHMLTQQSQTERNKEKNKGEYLLQAGCFLFLLGMY